MPISESVELDISSALVSVDDIGTALSNVVANFSNDLTASLTELQAAPVTVPVEADAATMGGSIDEALNAVNATIPVEADTTAMVAEIDTAAADANVVVSVTADTTEAQTEIDALGQSSSDAGGSVDDLSTKAQNLTGSLTEAGAAGGSMSSVLGALPEGAIPGAGAVLAVTAATDKFFNSAVGAESANIRFTNTFGPLADQVNHVEVGSLNTSLEDLGRSLGSSNVEIENALSTFGQLGKQSGATGGQIAIASDQLAALSANAVALNPNLGSVGDVAERLDKLLGRGGPRLAQYGISLDASAISAKAMEIALARGSDTVTQFDKRAAGAALATEQLGAGLKNNIEKAAANPIIVLRQLALQFEETSIKIGTPLVVPILDLLKSAEPALLSIAKLVGTLGTALVSIAGPIIAALSPVVTILVDALAPVIERIPSLVAPFTPIFSALGGIFGTVASAVGDVVGSLGPMLDALGTLGGLIAELQLDGLKLAFLGLEPAIAAVGKVLAFFVQGIGLALGAVVEVIGDIVHAIPGLDAAAVSTDAVATKQADIASATEAATSALFAEVDSTESLKTAFDGLSSHFSDFLLKTSEFKKNDLISALNAAGISADDLFKLLEHGTSGALNDFVTKLSAAGQIKVEIRGVEQTTAQLAANKESLLQLLNTGQATITQGGQLVQTFVDESGALDGASKSTLDNLVATGKFSEVQVKAATEIVGANGHIVTQTLILDELNNHMDAVTIRANALGASQESAGDKTAKLSTGLAQLSQHALDGSLTTDELKKASSELGIEQDKLKKFTDGVSKAFVDFKDSLVKSLPDVQKVVGDAAKTLDDATSPDKIVKNLQLNNEALTNFRGNVQFLINGGFDDLARIAIQRGPEFTNAIVHTIQVGRPGLAAELNHNIASYQQNVDDTSSFLQSDPVVSKLFNAGAATGKAATDGLGQHVDFKGQVVPQTAAATTAINNGAPGMANAAGAAGRATTDAYGNKIDLPGATQASADNASGIFKALGLSQSNVVIAAGDAGLIVGVNFTQGIDAGLRLALADTSPTTSAAKDLVHHIEDVVRKESGTHSPSLLFAGIGSDFVKGLAQGMNDDKQLVVAAAEAVVRDAANAAGRVPIVIPGQVPIDPNASSNNAVFRGPNLNPAPPRAVFAGGLSIDVHVNNTDPPLHAPNWQEVGQQVGQGFMSALPVEAFIS